MKKMNFLKKLNKKDFLKRAFDILFSLFVLLAISPIFLLISVIILITSGRPIFYKSIRIGKNEKIITCYKFRTMRKDADKYLRLLLKTPEIKKEWINFRKIKNDPRITSFGSFLRKTSLDELPQFINVLKGELSTVGPRPVKKNEVQQYFKNKKNKILSVRPGITGLWQISVRNSVSMEERIKIEEKYVDNNSFLSDLIIILKTIPKIFIPTGA